MKQIINFFIGRILKIIISDFIKKFNDEYSCSKRIIHIPFCYHMKRDVCLNERPNGFGVAINKHFILNFTNSHMVNACYFGRTFNLFRVYDYKINLHFGALYGYGDYVPNINGWTTAPILALEKVNGDISTESLIMPNKNGVFAWTIKKKI